MIAFSSLVTRFNALRVAAFQTIERNELNNYSEFRFFEPNVKYLHLNERTLPLSTQGEGRLRNAEFRKAHQLLPSALRPPRWRRRSSCQPLEIIPFVKTFRGPLVAIINYLQPAKPDAAYGPKELVPTATRR
jgi:hypothetical protein